jgi:hypothetical protein
MSEKVKSDIESTKNLAAMLIAETAKIATSVVDIIDAVTNALEAPPKTPPPDVQ